MESHSKISKRQRSENWLEEDKVILKELIRERVLIVENKNTDANTNAKKVAAWNNLLTSFNSMAHTPRTLQQIKAQWGIMKMSEKKRKFLERKERLQTGGGPPPDIEPPTGDDISVWLPQEFSIDSNEFDSDNQPLNCKSIKKLQPMIINSPLPFDNPGPETEMMAQPGPSIKADHSSSSNNLLISQASTSSQAENNTSDITYTPRKKKFKSPHHKLKNEQIHKSSASSAALQIADVEIACRKELHEAQMANEKQKLNNLLLKQELLKMKLLYYKNKLN